jgi:hypothetical protein
MAIDESNLRDDSPYLPDDRTFQASGLVIRATWRKEPVLGFAGGRLHVDAKVGLARYGPASLGTSRHPAQIRIGFVGSGQSIASAQRLLEHAAAGVDGDPAKAPRFPGFMADRGFFSELVHPGGAQAIITTNELAELKKIAKLQPRFAAAIALVSEKVKLVTTKDDALRLIVLALPSELLGITKKVRYNDPVLGLVYRDLRRALKAELMRHKVPTQIILQRVSEAAPDDEKIDPPHRVAWNLLTSMFFKGGGIPWKPVGLRADTCYIGISFHRPMGTTDATLRASVAQAFDENGTGLILRGPDFQWHTSKDGPSPHLNAEQAKALLELVLPRYEAEAGHLPSRVVIHKTSRFWDGEREGFQSALSQIREFDLIAVAPTSEVRLLRAGNYPPLRGTLFSVGDISYVYTTGYTPAIKAYPHGHVPAPLQIADRYGDSSLEDIVDEILVLTKMNWNTTGFAGALPITIRFSRQVGNIMREIPADRDPMPQFAFYT